ncbi:MAG: oxidoreductase [Verrucomicrobia bacterium 61-8]|nr:glucose 1-dehydrogenase [Verrucomicrobiota bacterium]OJV17113.1 MAG: oxidoreductase [Verrucomicrobia bacterium 61-8]
MSKLDGKIAVVTGGSSGIGLAIAQKFVEEGAYVFITGRRQAELDKAVAAIGKNVTAVQSDVAKLEDLDRLYEQVKAEKGALDIIVANAGIAEFAPLGEVTVEHYNKIFDINVRGVLFTTQKALPLLRDGGSIVVVASVVQYLGFPGASVYSATKAAVRSFVRTWAAELKGRGIRVNSLSPGPIDTPILDGQYKSKEEADAMKAGLTQMVPLGRLGRSEEIAAAALFLASSDSSYSTGIDLLSDGGMADI